MKKFLLFVGGLIAFFVLLANIGPMIILGLSLWLLYIVFKKFVATDSTGAKVGWIVVGLLVLSISLSNIYAIIGVAAVYVLYLIMKSWKEEPVVQTVNDDDPFTNFEREWADLHQ